MPANPKRYRELSEPFASSEEADAAIKAFMDDVEQSRVKHKVRDVYLVIGGSAMYESGEGEFITRGLFGDEGKAEMMAAWALGHESACRQERITGVLERSSTAIKQPRDR